MQPDRSVILDFLSVLPVRKIPSIGGMTETTLMELGIETAKGLMDQAADLMIAYSSYPKTHNFLIRCGLGLGQDHHNDEKFE